jgi:hypothetical protein
LHWWTTPPIETISPSTHSGGAHSAGQALHTTGCVQLGAPQSTSAPASWAPPALPPLPLAAAKQPFVQTTSKPLLTSTSPSAHAQHPQGVAHAWPHSGVGPQKLSGHDAPCRLGVTSSEQAADPPSDIQAKAEASTDQFVRYRGRARRGTLLPSMTRC